MRKFLGSLFFIALAGVVFAVVAKDVILKTAIEQGATRLTGFVTTVESLSYTLPSTIQIKGLRINNPEGFEKPVFANIPEIYISFFVMEFLKGQKIHFPEVRLAIQEVNIEKNEKGVSNIELLSSVGGPKKAGQPAPPAPPAIPPKQLPFWVEKLSLTLRNVSYLDRSSILGKAPVGNKIELDLNVINETFTDIRDPKSFVNVILAKILSNATFGRLLNIDPQRLLIGAAGNAKEILGKSVGVIGNEALLVSAGLTKKAGSISAGAKTALTDNAVREKAESLIKSSGAGAKGALGDGAASTKNQVSGLLGKMKSLAPTVDKTDAGK